MKSWLRTTLKVSGIVLVVLIVPLWGLKYLLFDKAPAIPETTQTAFDLEEVRALARSMDGPLPLRLNLLEIADVPFLRTAVFAGGGFGEHRLHFSSLQLVYETYTVIIDPVHSTQVQDLVFPGGTYDPAAYETLQDAMRKARLILATHEHIDHVGGIGESPYVEEIQPAVRLTQEQIDALKADEEVRPVFPLALLEGFAPLVYEQYHAIAPGVVLVKAPGHTPGTQMIYVRLQNQEEWLLVGDIVWHMDNVRHLTGRPWITNLVGGEDRTALAHQLRLLYDLDTRGDLHLLVAHDKQQQADYIAQGLLNAGFE